MAKIYVGNLPPGIPETEVEREFERYGRLRSCWVARKPPGFGKPFPLLAFRTETSAGFSEP